MAVKRMRRSKRESPEERGRKVGKGKIEIFAFQWVGCIGVKRQKKNRQKSGCYSSVSFHAVLMEKKGADAFYCVLAGVPVAHFC